MLLLWTLALYAVSTIAATDFSQYANVFAGTAHGGNTFPGAMAGPFAPVKLGPDFVNGKAEAYSGYLPDTAAEVTGFSLLHESGTGGAPKYGVIAQMPIAGVMRNPLAKFSIRRSKPDEGSVGTYKSSLDNGVVVELAASNHAGFYQYTFPSNTNQENTILVDISHVLASFRPGNWGQTYQGGSFTLAPDGRYEGSGVYNKGWNLAPNWEIFFCGKFDSTPASAQTFVGSGQTLSELGKSNTVSSNKDRLGGVFTFKQALVTSRVAVSWTSTEQACRYLDSEIPSGTKLNELVNAAKSNWNAEVFSKIQTTDDDNQSLTELYTSLYGMHILPSNRTGDNPKWKSAEPTYDDIFTFWDLFRCTTPLFHIIQPTFYEELLRSIIDVWRHDGWLPDARSSNFNGRTQGGSNADNILADAYVKGVRGAINWDDGYQAMISDAEKTPPNNNDPSAPDSSTQQGRGALPDWLEYGWITPKFSRAITRAVEYAGNDFALHQVASGLGKSDDALMYLQRSRNWRNHWDPNAESLGTKGFLVPRLANGSLIKQDPTDCLGCYWREAYYEGTPWEYTMNAHHDVSKLIEMGGGSGNFVKRLNTLLDPSKKIFNPGNEPSFTTPYLYNFVGRQDLSVKQSRGVAKNSYHPGAGGLPGASDAGAIQSWVLWNMIGLYPVTGQTTFLIGSPWLKDMTIQVPGGKTLHITSTGGDSDNYYVQSLKVNGKSWNKNWVTWNDIFANGGSLDFVLGSNPTRWDTGDLPPSPASDKAGPGDSGAAAKFSPLKGPAVDGPRPPRPGPKSRIELQRQKRRRRMEHLLTSVLGVLTLIASIVAFWWLWRIGIFVKKKIIVADTDKEGQVADGEKPALDVISPKGLHISAPSDEEITTSHTSSQHTNAVGGNVSAPPSAAQRWKIWTRRG
ncbi:glycoside hydrolase family 92 protein [Venturia nashicola]|uniref:Glycoside hydrolase family 92 protein n=1 Tax=Venturia nashicola TaxID=86259 RepID=A0A4Z1P828_9PEZI|nr:glycoside hydrolase family 92 protein [Venturia nashicola]